jgi:ferredoxin
VGVVAVDLSTCVRCGACAIVAPTVFELSRKGTRVLREPADHELPGARAAALICPRQSITIAHSGTSR